MEAQSGVDSKCLFRPDTNLLILCSLLKSRGSVFQILAPLYLKEPCYLVDIMIFCGKFFSRDLKGSDNENNSDVEKGSNSKSLEISSDSELSLEDESLMEVQVSKVN